MNNGLRVAAVVVTYNRLPLLQQCLAALKAQTVPPAAVWVIDNASTDGTREAVLALDWPELIYRNRMDGNGALYAGGKRRKALRKRYC